MFFPRCLKSSFSLFPPSVRRQNMKVRINATGDTIVMKFVRPSPDVKLEGYILGYGSSMFSKQFIQLPENGQPYETEMGTETCRLKDIASTFQWSVRRFSVFLRNFLDRLIV